MKRAVIYPNLLAEMARHGESRRVIAKIIGIAPSTVTKKLLGVANWNLKEVDILCEHYKMDYHVLFKRQDG